MGVKKTEFLGLKRESRYNASNWPKFVGKFLEKNKDHVRLKEVLYFILLYFE